GATSNDRDSDRSGCADDRAQEVIVVSRGVDDVSEEICSCVGLAYKTTTMHTHSELGSLSVRQLRARRRRLAASLADPQASLEGSLVSQMRRCGKEGCRCAQGELHGPYVYLSISRDAHRRLVYIPAELAEVVRR